MAWLGLPEMKFVIAVFYGPTSKMGSVGWNVLVEMFKSVRLFDMKFNFQGERNIAFPRQRTEAAP